MLVLDLLGEEGVTVFFEGLRQDYVDSTEKLY